MEGEGGALTLEIGKVAEAGAGVEGSQGTLLGLLLSS